MKRSIARRLLTCALPLTLGATGVAQETPSPVGVPTGPIAKETFALFDYDREESLEIEELEVLPMDGFDRVNLTYKSPAGGRVPAYLYQPEGEGPFAGILMMHGLPGTREHVDNLAQNYARTGAVVVSINAPWARPNAPRQNVVRFTPEDRAEQIQLIQDMRRAIDLLESFPWVDKKRLGYVGGSYGGAMGGLLAGVEKRVKAYVLMVGDGGLVAHFTGAEDPVPPPNVTEAQWASWLKEMGEIEPIRFVAHAAPAELLFQNGKTDRAVPAADAKLYRAAGSEPKTTIWYETGHGITPEMLRDQVKWMGKRLGIDSTAFPGL